VATPIRFVEEHRMRIDSSSHDAENTRMTDSATEATADEIARDGEGDDFEWPVPEDALSIEVLDLSRAAEERRERERAVTSGARLSSFERTASVGFRGAAVAKPRALTIALVILATLVVAEGLALTRLVLRPNVAARASAESVHTPPPAATTPPVQRDNQVATIRSRAASTPRPVASPSTPVASARLVIVSEPSGAQVSIDGRAYGTTPLTLANVTPGERRIVLRRGSVQVRQTVMVDAGRTVSIVAPMQQSASTAAGGWLSISSPVDVDVMEGGNLVGTSRSPQMMLGEGTHAISLVNDAIGYKDNEQIQITAGTVTHLAVKLPQTMIAINAVPWAEVSIDGKVVGVTPLGNVPVTIGPHEVVFRHPELGDKKMTTIVKAGVPARLSADLRRQ
jgi:PEGA domain-containing protein